MAGIKIEVRGLQQSINDIDKEFRDFMERVATATHQEAPRFTPKRTGRARAGWEKRMTEQGKNFEVKNEVPYVEYLEKPYLKSRQAPVGIIGPTLTSVKRKVR
jgi:hypothetical protein